MKNSRNKTMIPFFRKIRFDLLDKNKTGKPALSRGGPACWFSIQISGYNQKLKIS